MGEKAMKKGFTLTEILISIVLISIIMVFLTKLLIQVAYEKTNELYDTANAINRAEIINTVEKDFFYIPLKSLNCQKNKNDVSIEFLNNKDKIFRLSIIRNDNDTFVQYSNNLKTQKWKLEKSNSETFINTNKIKYKLITSQDTSINNKQYYALQINIPVVVDEEKIVNNTDSVLDDLVFNFYGEGVDYNFPKVEELNCN